MRRHISFRPTLLMGSLAISLLAPSCSGTGGNNSGGNESSPETQPRASDARRQYPLGSLPTSTITINGHAFRVWLAQEFDDQKRPGVVQEGLMYVPTSEIADDQGMLFVFSDERERSFWMRNTIAPLDIAFARMNGTIVKIWQMPPLTLQTFPSIEPAMFALEVKQGTFPRLGIQEGNQIIIPADVFKLYP